MGKRRFSALEAVSKAIQYRKVASNRKQSPPPVGLPTVTASQGIELIKRQIEAGQKLLEGYIDEGPYSN
jgi:hypothetical protein